MKRFIIVFLLSILLIGTNQLTVQAKDSVYSLNKYHEEIFSFIKDSYNKDHKKDGLIVGGNFLKEKPTEENKDNKDYQIILVKYNNDGKVLWEYTYGKTKEDKIDELVYTYDENNNVDGYAILLEKSLDKAEQLTDDSSNTTVLKVDLTGNLVWEKTANINKKERIKRIIPIYREDKSFDYYIGIGSKIVDNVEKAITVKYDRDWNLILEKECQEANIIYKDITPIIEENKVKSFALIKEKLENEQVTVSIEEQDQEGNPKGIIKEQLEKYDSYQLSISDEGFILYGITPEVKLTRGAKSGYVIKYDKNNQEEWETIGDFPTDSTKSIHLLPLKKDNQINKYFLEYINSVDASLEVIELDKDGMFRKKHKKISAEYYNIENFLVKKDNLYFVGQINCQKDDTCAYDSNSLLLISDEDKIIEVKEEDTPNILFISIILVIGAIILIFIKKRKKSI